MKKYLSLTFALVALLLLSSKTLAQGEEYSCGDGMNDDCIIEMFCDLTYGGAVSCYIPDLYPELWLYNGDVLSTPLGCDDLQMQDPCYVNWQHDTPDGYIIAGDVETNPQADCGTGVLQEWYSVYCPTGGTYTTTTLSITRFVYIPPPVGSILPGERAEGELGLLTCMEGAITCTADPIAAANAVSVYVNGIFAGPCGGAPLAFTGRPPLTSTYAIYNDYETFVEYDITATCALTYSLPTLPEEITVTIMSPMTVTALFTGAATPGFSSLMPDFGGDIETWLTWALIVIQTINKGNLLFIVSAIGLAGMILAWAIDQVKRPRSW